MSDQKGADLIRRDASVTDHYGLTVIELGEDGGTLVVLGHHDNRRTLAAFARYARKVWGNRLDGLWGLEAPTPDEVQRVRAVVVHACHRGWNADDGVLTAPELVQPDAEPCADCLSEVGATWALLYRADVQDHPAAFPVTVWEYDL
jgi:hypothetical protein